jgi:hypothetical protein
MSQLISNSILHNPRLTFSRANRKKVLRKQKCRKTAFLRSKLHTDKSKNAPAERIAAQNSDVIPAARGFA